ncbi:MAG: hypothetical protein P8188_17465 [Gemmatimonadota bacterium]
MKSWKLANWAEVIETVVLVASAALLILEVRSNTQAVRLAAYSERSDRLVSPYLEVEGFTEVYDKIKAVDREFVDPAVVAFAERYDLGSEGALTWVRYLDGMWRDFEGQFIYGVALSTLERDVGALFRYPDQQLYFASKSAGMDPEFVEFVMSLPGSESFRGPPPPP